MLLLYTKKVMPIIKLAFFKENIHSSILHMGQCYQSSSICNKFIFLWEIFCGKFYLRRLDEKSYIEVSSNQLDANSVNSSISAWRSSKINNVGFPKSFISFEIFYFWPLLTQITLWILDKGATSVQSFDHQSLICRLLRHGVCRWQSPVIGPAHTLW